MYKTEGVDAIASITELRSDTVNLLERVRRSEDHVLIQKNNGPQAVLIDPNTYRKVKDKLEVLELSAVVEDS